MFEEYEPITTVSTEYDPGVVNSYATEMETERKLINFILLSLCTFGVYSIYFFYKSGRDMDIIALRDGKRTLNFIPIFLVSLFTVFPMFIWGWTFSDRIGLELARRKCKQKFSSLFYWIFVLLIPGLCGAGIFCLWFFNSFLGFSTLVLICSTVGLGILICASFWIYVGLLIASLNELSRCLKYKNIVV